MTTTTLHDEATHEETAAVEELRPRRGEAAAFRIRMEERMRNLENQFEELKGRINGLLFFVAGTVIAQALLRVLE